MMHRAALMRFLKKRKRFWLIGGLIVLSGLFLVTKWLQSYTDHLLGKAIAVLVDEETNSEYCVSYADLQFELFDNKLQLTQLEILPCRADSLINSTRYALQVKQLTLETESLWKIYFTKELKIIGLTFIKPSIKMITATHLLPQNPTFSRQTGNLYLLIKNYLDKFQIQHFALYQATLEFIYRNGQRTSDYRFTHVNFRLQNLVIDSASVHDKRKIFYADGFDLSIDGQEIILPDSLHAFTFDKLEISTQKSAITFRNFRLFPRQGLPKQENAYQSNMPELILQGVDFARAYNYNHLIIHNLSVRQPQIAINRATVRQLGPSFWKADRTFLKIMASIFDSVAIGKLSIHDGAFALTDAMRPRLILPELDFSLDSFAFAIPDTSVSARFPTLKNAALTLRNQQFFMGDSLYTLRMQYLHLTSHPPQLHLAGIVIDQQHRHGMLMADSVLCQLHNWAELATNNVLHFRQIRIVRPQLNLQGKPTWQGLRATQFAHAPKPDIKIKDVIVDRLLLHSGHLQFSDVQQLLRIENCHAQVNRLRVSVHKHGRSNYLSAASINLLASSFFLQNPHQTIQMHAAKVHLQAGLAQVVGEAATLTTRREGADLPALTGSIRAFAIKNWVISQWQESQRLVFDTLYLQGADLNWQLSNTFGSGQMRNLRGTVAVEQSSLTVRKAPQQFVSLFGVKGKVSFLSDSLPAIHLAANNWKGAWIGYRFAGKWLLTDTQNGNYLFQYPEVYQSQNDSLCIYAQQLALQNWDSQALFNKKQLKINKLVVKHISGNWLASHAATANKLLDSLYIDTLSISGNELQWQQSAYGFGATDFAGMVLGLRWSSVSGLGMNQIATLQVSQGHFQLPSITLSIAKASLADTLALNSLRLAHNNFDAYFQRAAVTLVAHPKPRLRGLPISILQLADGNLNWHPDSSQQILAPALHSYLNALVLQNIQITGKHLGAHLQLLRIDNTTDSSTSAHIQLHANKLRWHLPNGRDELHIGKLLYDSNKQHLLLDSVCLRPVFSIEEFYRRFPTQKSHNTYAARRVIISKPQWSWQYPEKGWAAASAKLEDFQAEVFLDRTMPPVKEVRLFPLDKFRQMRVPVQIDTVQLANGRVCYRERTRHGDTAAFHLHNLQGYGYKWNNRPAPSDVLHVWLTANLDNQGEIAANIDFKSGSQRGEHVIYSAFSDISLPTLNSLTVPMAGIRVKSGQIDYGDMEVTADHDHAAGKMSLYYKNLKFVVLNRKTNEQEELVTRPNPFLSIFANTLIRNKNRRKMLYKGKIGYISQVREPDKSLFSFWGRIVLNGTLSSMGISQRLQAKWQQQVKERAEKKE
ncbi:MAG: DUF748 domain-containing protein [Cytophagales bacterium]|nr:DUF748 domain-containing protein [Bernardetiaceae bacterium]MDW8205762.1 DUF748 domain-containing protein [Cytophagales bacterium]